MRAKTREEAVTEFQSVVDMVDNPWTPEVFDFRESLIAEEAAELMAELSIIAGKLERGAPVLDKDKEKLLKEMADLQYVLSGTAVQLGLPLQLAFNRVHKSNMTKFENGKALRREDGKVLKSPNYKEPSLADLVV